VTQRNIQRHETSRGLSATAELLVVLTGNYFERGQAQSCMTSWTACGVVQGAPEAMILGAANK